MGTRNAAVAAGSSWTDPEDGIRYPAGEVHAWEQGRNETVCGLSLVRSRLTRFPHVSWADVQPESGRHAEEVQPSAAAAERAWARAATTAAGRGPIPGPDGSAHETEAGRCTA